MTELKNCLECGADLKGQAGRQEQGWKGKEQSCSHVPYYFLFFQVLQEFG